MRVLDGNLSLLPAIAGILSIALFSPVVLHADDQIPPSAPSDLTAEATGCGHVGLSWSASTDEPGGSGLYAYTVQRWQDGKLWNETTIRAPRTHFSDTNR